MSDTLHPVFIERIHQQFGAEGTGFLNALELEPMLSVRLNPCKVKPALPYGDSVPWCGDGFYLSSRPVFTLDPLFHAGCYYPQEASSQFLMHVLEHLPELPDAPVVLDLCGAPGGKTTLLASFMNNRGLLVANETIRPRASILRENTIKWGYGNVMVTQNDPADFSRLDGFFDLLVVDAPCSGEGMFRKDLSSRNEWTPENAAMCASRQRRILADCWPSLKGGGYLIYSTCTFNPAENEENINWLLEFDDAEVVSIPVEQSWDIQALPIKNGWGYGFYPYRAMGEGFFITVVRKLSETKPNRFKQQTRVKPRQYKVPENVMLSDDLVIDDHNGHLFGISGQIRSLTETIKANLRVLYCGTPIGVIMKDELIPDHAVAMSVQLGNYYPTVELSLNQALLYLKGETSLQIALNKGWHIVTFQGQSIGFVKSLGNRLNNYFPKEWRIRMQIQGRISE